MSLESDLANIKKEVLFVKEVKIDMKKNVNIDSDDSESYENLLQSTVVDILNDTIPDVI
jgi:hypothetical protein